MTIINRHLCGTCLIQLSLINTRHMPRQSRRSCHNPRPAEERNETR
ncbi:hypothetical protein OIU78_026478 [Salix suchowensis]|nr:hypothetical protein OIU78_026478 [Salix suchowensis]